PDGCASAGAPRQRRRSGPGADGSRRRAAPRRAGARRDRRADTDSFRARSSDPGWARGRPAVRRPAPWSAILFFPLEAIARAADQRLLGGILDRRLGIGEREPAHGIHLIVAVRETAAAMAHQEEAHPLENAHGRAVVVAARVPVGHVAEGVLDLADEP